MLEDAMVNVFSSFELSFADGTRPERWKFEDFRWALNAAKGYAVKHNQEIVITEKGKLVGKVSKEGKYENLC